MNIVKACGEALTKLEEAHSPKQKAAVLVVSHKVLVEGLEKVPTVRLKPQDADEVEVDGVVKRKDAEKSEPMDDTKPLTVLEEPTVPSIDALRPSPSSSPSPLPSTPPPAKTETLPQTPAPIDPASVTPETPHHHPPALSLDTIFPLLILSVVKANPPRLISHLLYTQRFRNRSFGGEEAYCLVNLMAVAEFIGALDPSTVTSTRLGILPQVSTTPGSGPIPIPTPSSRPGSRMSQSAQSTTSTSFTLRHRVEQQVDALSTSAGRVLTGVSGVVDTSFGILKNMNLTLPQVSLATPEVKDAAPWNGQRDVLVRRDTGGFSIRGLKLPGLGGGGGGSGSGQGRREEEMVSVSRPGSVRSRRSTASRIVTDSDEDEDEDDSASGSGSGDDEVSDDDEDDDNEAGEYVADARSIKSFESMMSSRRRETKRSAKDVAGAARKSLSDRLARVSSGIMGTQSASASTGIKAPSPPASRRSSLLVNAPANRFDSPVTSPALTTHPLPLPVPGLRLAPPNKRLLECTDADELRLKDVAELLKEYKRLVEGVRSVGGFDDSLSADS
ncbi:guanyl-nucleotide exchange factor [Moniliophthora roreri MCA 2997]|uniref:Guanyl-nucleotide exchange factor n=1 Tax=Moniliophthora roreri (strain MCA 2997) TaxID=1381753 RepID=V2WXY2_MONRO|nr:guanyl-nucleotide exchange factor [Moniliophthora roreri MCA 2997]